MKTDFEKDIESRMSFSPQYETGIVDNVVTGYQSERRENLPIVSRWISDTEADQRGEALLLDLYNSDKITHAVIDSFTYMGKLDVEGAMNYIEKKGISSEFGAEEYVKERNEEFEMLRQNDQQILDRSNRWGVGGEFIGRMAATFTDPVYLATLPIGIGASNTILSAALRSAALEMGIEAMAVPFIWDFKKEVGADYGFGDAVNQVLFTGLGGGILGGLGKAAQKLVKQASMTMRGLREGDIEGMSQTSTGYQNNTPVKDSTPYKEGDSIDTNTYYMRGEEMVGPGVEDMDAYVRRQTRTGEQGPGFKDPDQKLSDVDQAELQQKMTRIDDLEAKERTGELTETEMDELDMLVEETKAGAPTDGSRPLPPLDTPAGRAVTVHDTEVTDFIDTLTQKGVCD